MTEVGPVRFAQTAFEASTRVLPLYRTTRSKHIFTQPQLLATLLLMRFEDWTFRETEVRLLEHRELRRVLGLKSVPDYTTLYRFMKRLGLKVLDQILADTVACLPARSSAGAEIAVDGTGLSSGSISTYFVKRTGTGPRRHYLKLVVAVDVGKLAITAQVAHMGPTNDTASLPGLVEKTRAMGPVRLVLADAEFDSRQNHDYIRNVTRGHERYPRHTQQGDGQGHGYKRGDAAQFSKETLFPQRTRGDSVFSNQTQALRKGSGTHIRNTEDSGIPAGSCLQRLQG